MKLKLKNIFVIRGLGVIFVIVFVMWTVMNNAASWTFNNKETVEIIVKDPELYKKDVKYVLQWTSPNAIPFLHMGRGNKIFYQKNCPVKSCYITPSVATLNNRVSEFDAILFHGPEILNKNKLNLPKERSVHQSYVFASIESSNYYPAVDKRYNDVFNFTWTYKLNSDIYFGYIIVKDSEDKIIGPNETVPWISIEDMLPINDTNKAKLANKIIAAAWFVSNCQSRSKRENVAAMIIEELKKYNMTVDVYGACGPKKCPKGSMEKCLRRLQRHYYFYFAFENSMSEDYVTEKLLNPLQNYAVPIVYGGANYTRFMPDGIYLDAGKLTHVEVAKQIVDSVKNKTKYYDFFKWHNHYSYHSSSDVADTDVYCAFCSFINNKNRTRIHLVSDFYEWWNTGN